MEWTSKQIRDTFLKFFEEKKHLVVPSAPMVVKDDPTLMFTNAGMNQFKDAFLGIQAPKAKRVTDTQKCLRVSGKHNDLEEVGVDTYHHTMFEMLGNWSFGDYFKQEAIAWAWELLVDQYGLDKSRLYATVFEGDASDGLPLDQEAADFWKQYLPEGHILACDKKDNFWEMGDTGPCGPCSEVHIDVRPEDERAKIPGRDLVNKDHPQVIEIWNLVFIQFNRKANGSLEPLPEKHVDTGMGFERLSMVLQGKTSSYDSDIFQPVIQNLAGLCRKEYGKDESTDIAFRVIADHIRAVAFAIADGQLPSNTGAGYVIRRILRRAIRYGFSTLGLEVPFIHALFATLEQQMGYAFPELTHSKDLIAKVILEEEQSFLKTLDRGIKRFNQYVESIDGITIAGDFAFELFDTFGFPIDLTSLMAREKDLTIDMEGFTKSLQAQKERSRAATQVGYDDWIELGAGTSTFVGYDQSTVACEILRYRKVSRKGETLYQIVLDQTPFYAESGGQIGDKGTLTQGSQVIEVLDTQKENNLPVHWVTELPESVEGEWMASVDLSSRRSTERNHSATHLLHHALRTVLGDHVQQKGSLVNSDYLRFDFSHFQKVSEEEIAQVQQLVQQAIAQDVPLNELRDTPIEQAKSMGAMALFGEKYGDKVRVIQFGDSVELCGGTHVGSTAKIGLFEIVAESAVASGVRRIEARTGQGAIAYVEEKMTTLNTIQGVLGKSGDPVSMIEQLLKERDDLSKQVQEVNKGKAKDVKGDLLNAIAEIGGMNVIMARIDLEPKQIKDIVFQLRQEVDNAVLIITSAANDKPSITVGLADSVVKSSSLNAGQMVRQLAAHIKGGGGGQPFFATAGGKDLSGLEQVLEEAKTLISG